MKSELKLLAILVSLVTVILFSSVFVMAGYDDITRELVITDDTKDHLDDKLNVDNLADNGDVDGNQSKDNEVKLPDVKNLTGLLIGLDASGGLTDVLMVAHFDVEENKVKIISVPRDLEIDYMSEPFSTLRKDFNAKVNSGEIDADIHQRSYSKVNAIYYDTGRTKAGLYYTKEVVEKIIGMNIDYIAVIDVYGFKDVVDAVGGVEFYVPQRMYYNDSAQDLHVDLQEGDQLLDGENAMGMVRYRKYVLGDLQRIQVQQDFMRALFGKIAATRDPNQLVDVVTSIYNIFDSDFGLNLALDYVNYAFDLKLDNLLSEENSITIPSWGEKEVYQVDGVSKVRYHQHWDIDQAHEVVQDLLNN